MGRYSFATQDGWSSISKVEPKVAGLEISLLEDGFDWRSSEGGGINHSENFLDVSTVDRASIQLVFVLTSVAFSTPVTSRRKCALVQTGAIDVP